MNAFHTVVLASVLASSPAFAHHSPSAYDQSKEVVFKGTITKVGWMNPHIYFTLAVTGADGTTVEQEVQAGSISVNTALGLTKDDLVPGKEVTVRAFPNRRGAGRVVWGLDVTPSDGVARPLDLLAGIAAKAESVQADSIAGRWAPSLPSVASTLPRMRSLPLTEAGRAALADIDSQRAADASCASWPAPRIMNLPVLRTIEVDADVVKLAFDWMGSERIVHLDQAEHPLGVEPSLQGHSIGRWEGDTLVIDTIGFTPNRMGVSTGVPSGSSKHLVERLSLTADRLQLQYEFTIEDPEYFSGPASFTTVWDHRPDLEPSGEECNPENAKRFLTQE